MAKNYRITIIEARPSLGQKCVVFDAEGQTYNAAILTTADHVKLRFVKSSKGADALVAEKGFDFEVAFGASDAATLAAFKELVTKLESPAPSSQSSTSAPQPKPDEKQDDEEAPVDKDLEDLLK